MSVKVLIAKVNKTYNIEVITSNDSSYSYYWRGDNLLDAYNSLYSELLKMNKLSDKIIFLYKTEQSGFIRYKSDKKYKTMQYLSNCYNDNLDNISYNITSIKDIKKENHSLIFLINKQYVNQIKLFIESLGIKKNKHYLCDYYLHENYKHNPDEIHLFINLHGIYSLYYDQVGLKVDLFYPLNEFYNLYRCKTKENYYSFYKEIVFKINNFIRTLFGYTVNKVILHYNNLEYLIDFKKHIHEIDHYQVEISNEK